LSNIVADACLYWLGIKGDRNSSIENSKSYERVLGWKFCQYHIVIIKTLVLINVEKIKY
jgi:hypothetical protein